MGLGNVRCLVTFQAQRVWKLWKLREVLREVLETVWNCLFWRFLMISIPLSRSCEPAKQSKKPRISHCFSEEQWKAMKGPYNCGQFLRTFDIKHMLHLLLPSLLSSFSMPFAKLSLHFFFASLCKILYLFSVNLILSQSFTQTWKCRLSFGLLDPHPFGQAPLASFSLNDAEALVQIRNLHVEMAFKFTSWNKLIKFKEN